MGYQWNLAFSFMKASKGRGLFNLHIWFSILGILIGVSFLVFTLSLYDGYVRKLETMIFGFFPQISLYYNEPVENETNGPKSLFEEEDDQDCQKICNGTLILEDNSQKDQFRSTGFSLQLLDEVKPTIEATPQVQSWAPIFFEQRQLSIIHPTQKTYQQESLRILGINAHKNGYVPRVDLILDEKSLTDLASSQRHVAVIAVELYEQLFDENVTPGTAIQKQLLIDKDTSEPFQSVEEAPERYLTLEIIGVFRFGIHKIAENMIITSLDTAQAIFNQEGSATFMGINLDDAYQAKEQGQAIEKGLDKQRFLVFNWLAIAGDMFRNLELYRRIIFIVLFFSIIITSFTIHNTLAIMILERKRQIGILLSMGLTRSGIKNLFVLISLIEALIGCAAGFFLGILAGKYFSAYLNRELSSYLPITDAGIVIDPFTYASITVLVVLVCVITAWFTSNRAAKLDPVQCLQAE